MKAKKAKDLVNELIGDLLGDDKTAPVNTPLNSAPSFPKESATSTSQTRSNHDEITETVDKGVRTSVGKFALRSTTRPAGTMADAALIQSENLRVAQQRLFELEQEIERLRREGEQLAAAGETVRKRMNELQTENERKGGKISELQERLNTEKEVLEHSLQAKDRELKDHKMKIEEYEMRLSTNIQKIRVRERELENRLELIKMESSTVVRSKDEMILELKRQIDQLQIELENYRTKGHELHKQINDKQEALRRTVKVLRLALSMLEGGNEDLDLLKKAK